MFVPIIILVRTASKSSLASITEPRDMRGSAVGKLESSLDSTEVEEEEIASVKRRAL